VHTAYLGKLTRLHRGKAGGMDRGPLLGARLGPGQGLVDAAAAAADAHVIPRSVLLAETDSLWIRFWTSKLSPMGFTVEVFSSHR
jgi:hypothetical protein